MNDNTGNLLAIDSLEEDSATSICLPSLKYGYRQEPIAWEELVQILGGDYQKNGQVPPDLDRLSRSVEQQMKYQLYQRDLLLTWRSVLDFVLCKTFDTVFTPWLRHPKEAPGAMNKYIAMPPLSEVKTIHKSLVLNDFPYYMKPGIDHYVLWKVGGAPCNDEDIQQAKQQLLQQIEHDYDECMLYWTNPANLKSIPEVDHVHILARRRNQEPVTSI